MLHIYSLPSDTFSFEDLLSKTTVSTEHEV